MNIWESAQKKLHEAVPASTKADAVIASSAISKFETSDFIALAMLCIDQAGVSVGDQAKIEQLILQGIPQGGE